MNPSPQNDFVQSTNAYRELCCYLEHAPDAQLLCDHTAVLLFRIHDPALREAGLAALRSQLFSRKMAGGQAESWFIDCEERIRKDMPGFLHAAEQQFVRAGLDAEAAQMEAERAKKQQAKPRILPASAFAPETTEYLIEPYLPRGMLSILGGVSAAGKTSLALDIASAVSAGRGVDFAQASSPAAPAVRILMASADSPHPPRPAPTLSEAADALDALLGFVGWADTAQIFQMGARRNISERTLRRAKEMLQLHVLRIGKPPNQTSYWYRSSMKEAAVRADILNQNEQLPLSACSS